MSYAVRMKSVHADLGNLWNFEKEFSDKAEFTRLLAECKSPERASWLMGELTVIRPMSHFEEDLFLPLIMQGAWQTHYVALNILTCIGCFFIDVLTMPIRVVTYIIDGSLNSRYAHPLVTFIQSQHGSINWIDRNRILVRLEWDVEEGNRMYKDQEIDLVQQPRGIAPGFSRIYRPNDPIVIPA